MHGFIHRVKCFWYSVIVWHYEQVIHFVLLGGNPLHGFTPLPLWLVEIWVISALRIRWTNMLWTCFTRFMWMNLSVCPWTYIFSFLLNNYARVESRSLCGYMFNILWTYQKVPPKDVPLYPSSNNLWDIWLSHIFPKSWHHSLS